MRIIIAGEPIAQQRPRFARRGVFVQTYNPQETEAGRWLLSARQQIKCKMKGALSVDVEAIFERPKSHYGTGKKAGILKTSAPDYCCNKKDIDNIFKFLADCLNGEAWVDDRQLAIITALKRWARPGECARTEIEIIEL